MPDYSNNPRINLAVFKLQDLLENEALSDADYLDITSHKHEVLKKYQWVFSHEHIPSLTKAEFRDFLLIKNNHHWNSIHRQGPQITSDMDLLRKTLLIWLDERITIEERINQIRPERKFGEHAMVLNLGMPVLTAILLIRFPDKFGVWNNTSDEGLRIAGLWKERWEKEPGNKVYIEMNDIYLELCSILNIDLWTLDALWWVLKKKVR